MRYLIKNLEQDPFNEMDLVEAVEGGIPNPEIVAAIKKGLESQIVYWKGEAKKVEGNILIIK